MLPAKGCPGVISRFVINILIDTGGLYHVAFRARARNRYRNRRIPLFDYDYAHAREHDYYRLLANW